MKTKISTAVVCVFMFIIGLSQVLMAGAYINSNYFEGIFDDAGYSDVINWGGYPENINHPYSLHEVLSGEWGCAIFYDGLSTDPNAMWLTTNFSFPNWTTNSTFYTTQSGNCLDDPCNPVVGYDTDQSKIVSGDGKVEITIDYEVVDLGDGNWSPLSITNATGQIGFVKSDRFLFLQTYTITNLQENADINGLEFYQMLHSHGADDYGPVVHASYTAANYEDILANYVPYNPIHNVGNFAYDFTQWNDLAGASHVDWVGFSCAIEPDVYDCNFYEGGHWYYPDYNPPTGTHKHIQNRNLNNVNYAYGETAGAMGWYLPNLGPQESTSITVAFMFGYGPIDYNTPPMPDCSLFDISPNPLDGNVNFLDFAVFANAWLTVLGDNSYNDNVDFVDNNRIDVNDLKEFCDCWLWPYAGEGSGGDGMMMSEPESMPALSEAEGMMSMASEQLLLLAGEGETASIYLLSDVNEPNSGDEVTVQVYSDVPLFCMGLGITVTGDANITDAMSTADCNQYGWDPSWPTDPIIDPTGWVYIGGVIWEADADGVVGYIKFRYNSGQISVSITEGDAFDANCEPALFSGEALTFGADPNES